MLREDLSPEQIVGRLRFEGVRVMSHETIYLHLWADKENGGTLWRRLRGARKLRRKRYGHNDSRGRLAGKKMIGERPAIVERRTRLGDWEIDTVHGRGKPATVTVVERKSGLVRIGKISRVGAQETLRRTAYILRNEPHPIHTITADNGSEFHLYEALEQKGNRPVRALQRLRAVVLTAEQAKLLKAQERDAGLLVARFGYLKDGRAVEFSQSYYRGDIYDFVAELSASS